jgi:hypothetical protein
MGRHVTRLWIENGGTGAIYYRAATEFTGTSAEGGELIPLEIPADHATVDYVLGTVAGLPAWVETVDIIGAADYAWLYLTGIEGSTGNTVLVADENGDPILAYSPTS